MTPDDIGLYPRDESNAALVSNVRPQAWVNPEPRRKHDLVVLGAGTAGLVTVAGAAALGARVAIVERGLMGGDCLNVGCVPSKSIIRSSRAWADARASVGYGVRGDGKADADFAAVMARMRRVRAKISAHDAAARFRDMGVDVYFGEGRFEAPDFVVVGDRRLKFRRAVIATGARPAVPAIPGLAEAGFLTNETVFNLTERPRRLAVFGAGPLGCELAQAMARLGSEVTIIERGTQLLPREDADAAAIVAEAFRRDGVDVRFGAAVGKVSVSPDGKVLHCSRGGREEAIAVDEILVGAGRAPNVEGLNLEAVGVEFDTRTGVHVDDMLRTTNRRIFAAGDVCLEHKFTHAADASARIVVRNALFGGRKKLSSLVIPWCTYTDPEIAHVGMYEKQAQERGLTVETFTRRFDDVDRPVIDGEEEGLVKIHATPKGEIVGATVVARRAGEMISEITLAIAKGVTLAEISSLVHPYPTASEAIRQAADAFNRTRLTPGVKWLLKGIMAVRR